MQKSCQDCPSRVLAHEVSHFFKGQDFGPKVEMCAVTGDILRAPYQGEEARDRLQQTMAEDCSSFGLSRPPEPPHKVMALVAVAEPTALSAMPNDENVESCSGCSNFIDEWSVRRTMDFSAPMCAAQGRLLMTRRLGREATDANGKGGPCLWRNGGRGFDSMPATMSLLPRYLDVGFDASTIVTRVKASMTKHEFVEPSTYETDAVVSTSSSQLGIRAWRKITSRNWPEKSIMIPVFDRDFFPEAQQAKIPATGSDEHPEYYVDHEDLVFSLMVEMLDQDSTPLVLGEAGTGKTEAFRHLAWIMQLPFERFSITGSTEVDDLIGKWLFRDGETAWQDGRLPKAWQGPCVIVIDEPNMGPQDVWDVLRPLTDNSRQMVLDAGEGLRIDRHDFTFMGMAMNPPDPKYIGANELNAADGDRLAAIRVDYPDEETEMGILIRACELDGYDIPPETLTTIMKIAADIREAADPENGTLSLSWGLRPQIAVARKTAWYPLMTAYRRALLDRLDLASARIVAEIINGYTDDEGDAS